MNIDPELEAKILAMPGTKLNGRLVARPDPIPAGLSEKAFQAEVMRLAKKLLWSVYHTHDSRKSAAGYPDLTFWRERVFFAELKDENGKLSAAQSTTIEGLRAAGAEVYVWRPSDWPCVVATLTGRSQVCGSGGGCERCSMATASSNVSPG